MSDKPVLFLDWDRVMNVIPRHYEREKKPETDRPDLRLHNVGNDDSGVYPMYLSADMGTAMHDLSQRAEFRWLTTWARYANEILSPIAGFPVPFPVAAHPGWGMKPWKWYAIEEFLEDEPGRSFVWVDDDAIFPHAETRILDRLVPPAKSLLVRTDPYKGISRSDLKNIDEFLCAEADR